MEEHQHYTHIRLETVFEFSSWSTFNFVDIVSWSQQLLSVMLLCGLVPQTWWRKYCQSKHLSGQQTDGSESDGSNHRNYWPAPYLNLQTQGGGGDLTSGDLAEEISIVCIYISTLSLWSAMQWLQSTATQRAARRGHIIWEEAVTVINVIRNLSLKPSLMIQYRRIIPRQHQVSPNVKIIISINSSRTVPEMLNEDPL